MDNNEKIKVLASMPGLGIKRLHPLGGSLALIIPRLWANFHCTEIDGKFYVQLQVMGDSLIFTAIDEEELERVNIRQRSQGE